MKFEDLKGKKVLVTGSSSGIGQAAAVMFAKQGCFVGVHYFRTKEGGEKTLQQVKEYSDGVLLRADMRDEEEVKSLVNDFVNAAGGLDVLVNNAGTLIERQDIEEATGGFHDNMYSTNVKSTFLATKYGVRHLKENQGNIVNIGSIAGHNGGGGGSGIYASAKAAVATFTIASAKEFSKYGIRVNSVLPGLIETRFHEQFSTPERKQKVAEKTPMGRNGTAEDVAKSILFLASSDAAGFITGEYIAVNGGLLMRP
jgi:3-oxoacyl-[acyl-carrier protein] reductase